MGKLLIIAIGAFIGLVIGVKITEVKCPPVEKLIPTISIILIREENGKLKAYKGFRKNNCGNPIFNPKDSIPVHNFFLIADSTELYK